MKSLLTFSLLATSWILGGCQDTSNTVVNLPPSAEESEVLPLGEANRNLAPAPVLASTPEPTSQARETNTPNLPPGYSVPGIKRELQRMKNRPCEQRAEQNIGAVFYWVCMDNSVVGKTGILAASSSLPGEQQGATYWFRDDGQLYAFEQISPGGSVFSVLADDRQTIITLGVQGEVEAIANRTEWEELSNHSHNAVAIIREELGADTVAAAGNPPVGSLLVAGQGGDFYHRTLTLTVPQSDTSRSVKGGALRWYDLHLATMVGLTADHYCNHQSTRGVYFNYQADGGDVFMGQFFISCSTARSIMDTYGREEVVWVTLNRPEADRDSIYQSIPNFTDATAREFQRTVVTELTPDCIETGGITICPGDRG